ncbi:hypothetical protein, partial [Microcystis aeruginosa]|uniref:hypothetical protein n=1 Tax=Microcystis aeruginosa TaxID=1126 RepID=UPI001E4307C7
YGFQLLLSLGTLIEFYFKLIICITIPEEPKFLFPFSNESGGHSNNFLNCEGKRIPTKPA